MKSRMQKAATYVTKPIQILCWVSTSIAKTSLRIQLGVSNNTQEWEQLKLNGNRFIVQNLETVKHTRKS
jgi:hypothetical protein